MKYLILSYAIIVSILFAMKLQENRAKNESLAACNIKGYQRVAAKRTGIREFSIECSDPIENKSPNRLTLP